jgi:vanillate O-demethylase monooxygenase subunit
MWVMNAMTPETEQSTHYFWASVRAHALDNEQADALFLNQVATAFDEDKVMLEAQQKILNGRPDTWDLALRSDAGAIESRRVLAALIEAEGDTAPTPA